MTPSVRFRRSACQRTEAAMLSVALALSTTVPAGVAFAHEPDQEQEGISSPEPTAPDSTTDPEYDPGGDTDLSFEIGTPRDGGGDDDQDEEGPPVDSEPVQDLDLPVPPSPDTLATPVPPESDEPTPPADLTPEPPARAPAPAPLPPVVVSPPAPAGDERQADRRPQGQEQRKRAHKRKRTRRQPAPPATVPATPVAPERPPAPQPVAVASQPAPVAAPARSSGRSHTVQPGESLWTIARDLLGPNASDSRIAATSNRIYELNRDRIGVDPNLVIAGTVLRLP